jgi:hypothetical protein
MTFLTFGRHAKRNGPQRRLQATGPAGPGNYYANRYYARRYYAERYFR